MPWRIQHKKYSRYYRRTEKITDALIIVSAHSKELLLSFCDEIFYMDDGRIIKNEKIQQTDNK